MALAYGYKEWRVDSEAASAAELTLRAGPRPLVQLVAATSKLPAGGALHMQAARPVPCEENLSAIIERLTARSPRQQ